MIRRIMLAALALSLLAPAVGCRETRRQAAARKVQERQLESLADSYDPKKVKEFVQALKGQGEGAKVKVYISPNSKDLVIGELNYATVAELIKEHQGWYAIRYYSRDGGTFYGWIKIAEARYLGTQGLANEVIPVEDEHKKAHLTLQETDDELMAILKVPYTIYQRDANDKPKKRFCGSGGGKPDGYDDISLLGRVSVTGETKQFAIECQRKMRELGPRAHEDYLQVIKAYYDALDWYVRDQKDRFVQMLGQAEEKRNEIARHFGG
jgi:hypothetical protein